MDTPGFIETGKEPRASRKPDTDTTYDLLILGGGPATMSAAIYASRKMLNIAIITRDFGGQMLETSDVENWLGFQSINALDLVEKFQEHVETFAIPVAMGVSVTDVSEEGGRFEVRTDEGKIYFGRSVIVATGKRHRRLNVPGEEELSGKGVSHCAVCDAPFLKEMKAVVIGGGNSGFTAALDLLKAGADVTVIQRGERLRADTILLERVKKFDKAHFLISRQVLGIEGEEKVTGVSMKHRKTGDEETIPADAVFVEIGLIANSEIVKDLLELSETREIMVDNACRTGVDGLFAAGDVTTVPYEQIVISAGEGAKAALAAYDYLIEKGLL